MPVFHHQDIYHPIILLHIILMQQTEVMITMEHLQIKLGKFSKDSRSETLPRRQDSSQKGETFIGELYLNGTGTAEAPIIIDGYGDKGHDPCIIGYDQSPYAVYVYNSSQITIQNLEIVNTGKDRLPGRTGVKVHLENYGTAHSITLRNLYIHDVNGSLVKSKVEDRGYIL